MAAKWVAFKNDVRVLRITPRFASMIQAAQDTAPVLHGDTLVITSCAEGQHSPGSAHYCGDAIDIRTHYGHRGVARLGCILNTETNSAAQVWVSALRRRLGGDYDVVYEAAKRHIHIEFDRS